jgi:hypothetical protein
MAAIILSACVMGLIGASTCAYMQRVPCDMPGLREFSSDALSALLGLVAGRAVGK